MPSHVVVVGGGFAGLRAAVALADAGLRVTVVDNRAQLGGRARSFTDPTTGEVVDNGQHLFLAGYHRTLAFLERLGTRDQVAFQPRLGVRFVESGGRSFLFRCPSLPAPFHLLAGLVGLRGLPLRDKWSFGARHLVPGTDRDADRNETVEQWLSRMGQGKESRRLFWDPLTIAALNEDPARASAAGLKSVLRTMLASASDSRLGMSRVGLSELYAEPAARILEQKGGRVLAPKTVQSISIREGKVDGVVLADGTRIDADAVISSVPPAALLKLLTGSTGYKVPGTFVQNLRKFSSSPILSVNLWLDRTDWVPPEPFVALIGTRFQWLFNKPAIFGDSKARYVSLIASAAYELQGLKNEPLVAAALEDLVICFPAAAGIKALRSQVVREQDATVSITAETEGFRPSAQTRLSNLFLAGDWTATGLPATIESAVLSGELAAGQLFKMLA